MKNPAFDEVERALALAMRHVNASMPTAIAPQTLLQTLNGNNASPGVENHLYAFFDEVEIETMSDLVRAGATTYARLATAAGRLLPPRHPTRLWLDERSGRRLAPTA